jgi:CheY-like chemotaxis protein
MEPVDLFYSYAREDEPLRDELAGHLKIMERRGVIRPWHDRCIAPGQKWDKEINSQLESADLVLLLVSKDFINSDYIWGHELETAMKRQESGKTSVVPVMLRAVDIDGAPFAELQGLPTDLRPVTSWPNRDEAWTDVAKGIRRSVEQIQARWKETGAPAPARPPAPPSVGLDAEKAMAAVLSSPVIPDVKLGGPATPSLAVSPVEDADPLLARVVDEFSDRVTEAARARGAAGIDRAEAKKAALSLIDAPEQKRVLWVDERPSNNRLESAALAKLQIEVVQVTDTEAALERIASDPEAFDLVLSDWHRPERTEGAPSAGIRLLRALRARHLAMPVVFYHGSFDARKRQQLHQLALAEGAYGEAVMPDELLVLVARSLGLR